MPNPPAAGSSPPQKDVMPAAGRGTGEGASFRESEALPSVALRCNTGRVALRSSPSADERIFAHINEMRRIQSNMKIWDGAQAKKLAPQEQRNLLRLECQKLLNTLDDLDTRELIEKK